MTPILGIRFQVGEDTPIDPDRQIAGTTRECGGIHVAQYLPRLTVVLGPMYCRALLLILSALTIACEGSSPAQDYADAGSAPEADADAGSDCETKTFYADFDGDGFGSPDLIAVDCEAPLRFVENDSDCNDGDALSHPEAAELCDGLDNDCNSETVETCPALCAPQNSDAGGIYLYCGLTLSHADSDAFCAEQGMHLARVDDQAEQAYLSSQRVVAFGGKPAVWIGGSDRTTEDAWLWQDGTHYWQGRSGGSSVEGSFSYWANGEPNDDGTEDCMGMLDNSSGSWNDFECGDRGRFICEREGLLPPS